MGDEQTLSHPPVTVGSDLGADPRVQALIRREHRMSAAAADMRLEPALAADALGYLARAFVVCGLPHTDPRDEHRRPVDTYRRVNGPYTLTLASTRGVPYGKIPRVFLAWVQTEVVRRKTATIVLGKTLTEAAETMGLHDGGSTLREVSKQIRRATATTYESIFHGIVNGEGKHEERRYVLTTKYEWRYDPRKADQLEIWDPTITISSELFQELVGGNGGVPFDWRMVRALRSPLAIDLYLYTSHVTHRIRDYRSPLRVSLKELHRALGSGYPETVRGRNNFQQKLRSAAQDLRAMWPELPIVFDRGGLVIERGRPHVSPSALPPAA